MPVPEKEIGLLLAGGLIGFLLGRVRPSVSLRSRSVIAPNAGPKDVVTPGVRTNVTVSRKFVVNGVTYDSIDQVPAAVRDKLQNALRDADGDGIPDIFQKK